MKKLFSSLFLFICLSVVLKAVPAYHGLLTKTQSDGSTISYYLRGDESCNFTMSEDGFLITTNQNGIFEYAELNDKMEIVPVGIKVSALNNRTLKEKRYLKNATKVEDMAAELDQIFATTRANNNQKRANASNAPVKRYPLQGSPTSLVILVNFTDVKFLSPTAKEDFTALLNQKHYSGNNATGSAKDFFEACSNGIFSPDFVVVGPYDLPKEMGYYGTDYGVSPNRNETYASQMIIDACKAADADVNFLDYDTDGNGYVDNVFVYYAGYNQAEGGPDNSVWPHRSSIGSKQNFDGVLLRDYACTSELKSSKGTTMCGIGTFCHEFGHVLSLPDFYVTDYGHSEPTLGSWSAMDQGPYNNGGKTPPSYSSYERFYLGWLTPTILEPGVHELKSLISTNTAYILAKETPNLDATRPTPSEFFMIENRQKEGWDSVGLPASGMLVTHIDWVDSRWRNNVVNNVADDMGVKIVCADETTRRPAFNPFPGASDVTTCFLTMKDGYKFPSPITAIKQKNGVISFIYGETPTTPYLSTENDDFKSFHTEFGTNQIKTFNFKGHTLAPNVKFELEVGSNFKLRKQGDESFKRFITIETNADSTLDVVIEIQFDPRRVTLEGDILTDRLFISTSNYDIFYDLEGISTKPVNVKKPLAYEAKDITTSSFVASWQEQPRATCYYLSVYSLANTVSSEIEDFAVFTEKERPDGWDASFGTSSSLYKLSTPISVYFKNDEDTLWSKEYFSPINKVNVWLNSNNTIGLFYVDGWLNDQWVNVYTKEITPNVKRSVETFELGENACTKFRMYYKASSTSTGGLCLDDFEAITYNTPQFVHKELEVYDTTMNVTNLINDKFYFYKLRASDKDLEAVNDPDELISAYSNEVTVKLVGFTAVDNVYGEASELVVEYATDGSGDVIVDLGENPTEISKLYIYSLDGRLIQTITPEARRVKIENLVENNLYVVKYSNQGLVNQTTKVGKIVF